MLETIVGVGVVLVLVVIVAPRLLKAGLVWHFQRTAKTMDVETNDPILAQLEHSKPAIIYFTADWCGPCKTVQTPAIERLQATEGDRVQVIKINADDNPELVKQWRVMSLPRTFILNSHHHIYGTNIAPVNEGILRGQLLAAESAPAGAEMLVLNK